MGSLGRVTVSVHDNPTASRFEIFDGDTLAGHVEYVLTGDELTLTHMAVADAFEGRGLAKKLTRAALTAARDAGMAVLPRCPYVAKYLRKHPEWLDLVPGDRRGEFGL